MVENFEDWGDYELGMLAKAFMDCGNHSCAECSCNGVLCNVDDVVESRKAFINEFANRIMA